MKLNESYQDVENYLRSSDLISEIEEEFSSYDIMDEDDVCQFVYDKVLENFETSVGVVPVMVFKVVGESSSLITSDHFVISYNGYYYDYTADQYNDSFNDLIGPDNLPIVQPVIKSDNQVSERVSTVKGYVMLGY